MDEVLEFPTPARKDNEEIDLIELLLKRQAELNALLEITQAINNNASEEFLIEMLEFIIKNQLRVGKFRLLIKNKKRFKCISKYGSSLIQPEDYDLLSEDLAFAKYPISLRSRSEEFLNQFEWFIPVYHKNQFLAYVLIGDFDPNDTLISNKIAYIQTLINVIVVALENKKLFKNLLKNERILRDLELAGEVQHKLIPNILPNTDVLDVKVVYKPHENIGGDYYDFIQLNKDEYLWCIADVSGKGISAALIMANFQAALKALVATSIPLKEIVSRLNKVIFQNTQGDRFITLFLAKYNRKSREIVYVNAGHNPPLLLQNNRVFPLNCGTTMIGVFEDLPFINQGSLLVEPLATVFNYTDGILDYDGDLEDEISEKYLIDFFLKNQNLELDLLHEKLQKNIEEVNHNAVATDDITVLTLRFF